MNIPDDLPECVRQLVRPRLALRTVRQSRSDEVCGVWGGGTSTMSRAIVKVGPADHGKRMSLDDFDKAEVQEGYLYELNRGVIVVSDVPRPRHLAMVNAARRQLSTSDRLGDVRVLGPDDFGAIERNERAARSCHRPPIGRPV